MVHLGNSSPVRYALIHNRVNQAEYYSNRGTAGIDGCVSTAVGFASESDKNKHGDCRRFVVLLRLECVVEQIHRRESHIIVIHNGGGNIFSMIKGPGETPAFQEHFFTNNSHKVEGLAKAFGLSIFQPTVNLN